MNFPESPRFIRPGLAVLNIPLDLIGQLNEPLDPVIAVNDREDVLLGGGAEKAVFAYRDHRRVPSDIRA